MMSFCEVYKHSPLKRQVCSLIRVLSALLSRSSKLTHISLASFLWDIGKECRPRPDAQNMASDQGLHCLLTKYSIKI